MKISDRSEKLADAAERARARLTSAENSLQSAKDEWKVAKRRRKEAKERARRAKKVLRRAKEELAEAEKAFAGAEEKHARQGAAIAKAKKRAKSRPVKATPSRPTRKKVNARESAAESVPAHSESDAGLLLGDESQSADVEPIIEPLGTVS
jgi:chromosome segregation ATPase